MDDRIKILPAEGNRQAVIRLLQEEKLPFEDLPAGLNNFFIATDGNTVIGSAGMEVYDDQGLLRSLVVHKDYRGLSIAAALVQAVETRAAELHLKGVYLLTETAKRYFEKKGYAAITRDAVPEAIKQSSEFSHVCPVSAVVMYRQITQP